ncbi:MAG: DUF4381 domain-containing protein [Pseudomonadota bacterium]
MTAAELLERLRDVHAPPPVGWWPPAPGWWWLAGGLLLALVLLVLAAALWRRGRARRACLRELARLRRQAPADDADRARELAMMNALLRRRALNLAPADEVAGLTGLAWLHFLDNTLEARAFSEGPGRILLDAPYRPAVGEGEYDRQALFRLAERWLRHARRRRRR